MSELTLFQGRRAAVLENSLLQVIVLEGGGHLAAVTDKATGISPLWIPPWRSIEPAAFDPTDHAHYGSGAEGRLLAGIMGHNLCLDIFGGPSAEEAASGLTAHGEGSIATYQIESTTHQSRMTADFPLAQLHFERELTLIDRTVRVREVVENLTAFDRPIGWTQHVTLGPPFLERGVTEFRASATASRVHPGFGDHDYLRPGAAFEWPHAPLRDGGSADLRRYTAASTSSAYTAHLLDQQRRDAFFVAFTPTAALAFGYVWRTADFPWLGIWEENHSRSQPPWNGHVLTRGLEFGVSPFPESRRDMVERGPVFGVPTFKWLPARARAAVEYWIICMPAPVIPEQLERPVPARSDPRLTLV